MKKVRKNKKVSETQRSEAQNKHNKERLAPKMERKVNVEDNHFSLKTDFPYRYGGKTFHIPLSLITSQKWLSEQKRREQIYMC